VTFSNPSPSKVTEANKSNNDKLFISSVVVPLLTYLAPHLAIAELTLDKILSNLDGL